MIAPAKPFKLGLASMLAIPLAALSGTHALSSTSLRNAPELSYSVFPVNGQAREKLAYQNFVGNVKESLEGSNRPMAEEVEADTELTPSAKVSNLVLQTFAQYAAPAAREALMREPLLPKAHAILALSETDTRSKRQLVALASRLNRREVALQGLVLQQRLDDRDYAGTIDTLDQILRVNPARKAQFFPLLIDAMAQDVTKPAFTTLLRDEVPWRDAFLDAAVGDERVLKILADIRQEITLDNLAFDQRLIAGLARRESLASAETVYRLASKSKQIDKKADAKLWQSAYPPFDWELTDAAGMRAQPAAKNDVLEFSIEPGNGGILASRLVKVPQYPFQIRIDHQIQPVDQVKDFKLQLACWGETSPFFEEAFSKNNSLFRIVSGPGCEYLELAIVARAWSGSEPLNGSLTSFEIFAQ